jgi:hypothetical protein
MHHLLRTLFYQTWLRATTPRTALPPWMSCQALRRVCSSTSTSWAELTYGNGAGVFRTSGMLDVDDCGRALKPWLGSFDYDHPEGPQIACVYLPYFALPLCCWRHLHERREGFPMRLAAIGEAVARGCTVLEVGDESLGHLYRWTLENVNETYIAREDYGGEEIVAFPFAQAQARHREPCACRSYSTELQAIYDAVMAERGSAPERRHSAFTQRRARKLPRQRAERLDVGLEAGPEL